LHLEDVGGEDLHEHVLALEVDENLVPDDGQVPVDHGDSW
jgi:hypothetical protein